MIGVKQVWLDEARDLVADVFNDGASGVGRVWVCVRNANRVKWGGWMGCWSSENASPEEGEVRNFLRTLAGFIDDNASVGPRGPVLTEYFFQEGWNTWGPGTPKALLEVAASQPSNCGSPSRIQDFRMDC
ncbi:hypothetical protein GCM10023080_072540 [Streptomyces pseudoechinosporeus]